MDIAIERAKEVLKILLIEANKLRIYRGKTFLSKRDIKKAWFSVSGICSNRVLENAEYKYRSKCKFLYQPQMGFAEVDRIINSIIPQQRTGIKVRSMQWAVSKSTRRFIYKLAQSIEKDDWQEG